MSDHEFIGPDRRAPLSYKQFNEAIVFILQTTHMIHSEDVEHIL